MGMEINDEVTDEMAGLFPGAGDSAIGFTDLWTGEHHDEMGMDELSSWIETHRPAADAGKIDEIMGVMADMESGTPGESLAGLLEDIDVQVDG